MTLSSEGLFSQISKLSTALQRATLPETAPIVDQLFELTPQAATIDQRLLSHIAQTLILHTEAQSEEGQRVDKKLAAFFRDSATRTPSGIIDFSRFFIPLAHQSPFEGSELVVALCDAAKYMATGTTLVRGEENREISAHNAADLCNSLLELNSTHLDYKSMVKAVCTSAEAIATTPAADRAIDLAFVLFGTPYAIAELAPEITNTGCQIVKNVQTSLPNAAAEMANDLCSLLIYTPQQSPAYANAINTALEFADFLTDKNPKLAVELGVKLLRQHPEDTPDFKKTFERLGRLAVSMQETSTEDSKTLARCLCKATSDHDNPPPSYYQTRGDALVNIFTIQGNRDGEMIEFTLKPDGTPISLTTVPAKPNPSGFKI